VHTWATRDLVASAPGQHRRSRVVGVWAAVIGLVLAGLTALAAPASAVTAVYKPGAVQERGTTGVTADALPTVQVDGIVWTEVMVGNTVYAGGSFSHALPPNGESGSSTPRGNLLAFDVTTGELITSFAPTLDGQVFTLAVSPDGKTLYVGGTFTHANGSPRSHVASYNIANGALNAFFSSAASTIPSGEVKAITVSSDSKTVYIGGSFGSVQGHTRSRLAALRNSDGALLTWAPSANDIVQALVLTPDGSRVVIGGHFSTMSGAAEHGIAAVSASTGAVQPYTVSGLTTDTGTNSAFLNLSVSADHTMILGTTYNLTTGGNFEGVMAISPNTGALIWMEDCHGDSYGAAAVNGYVYVVSHEHYCGNVGGFGDSSPEAWYRTTAFTQAVTGKLAHNATLPYHDWYGEPAPSQVNWYPSLATGNYSGAQQAAWAVVANSQYVVEGGEFPTVNGDPQAGLVRFAVPSIQSDQQGPRGISSQWIPRATQLNNTTESIAIQGTWDRDDQNLTYALVRNGTQVASQTVVSHFWDEPTVTFTDTGLSTGTQYSYKVVVTDPSGNALPSATINATPQSGHSVGAYEAAVLGDGARDYWRMNDSSTANVDSAGFNDLGDSASGITRGGAAATGDAGDGSVAFDGKAGTTWSTTTTSAPDAFTEELWFKTTATAGGKLIGFGNQTVRGSYTYDRAVYIDATGHLYLGVNPGTIAATGSGMTYNDGVWHYLVAENSAAGIALYVDGVQVGRNAGVTHAATLNGFWRIGGDTNSSAWPGASGQFFTGSISDVAIYPYGLTNTQIHTHYTASGHTLSIAAPPADSYGSTVYADNPQFYYRFNGTTSAIGDSGPNATPGVLTGTVHYSQTSPVSPPNTGILFDGKSGTVSTLKAYYNPVVYSNELWFRTPAAATTGGQLIGFGNKRTGASTVTDRKLYMTSAGKLVFAVNPSSPVAIVSPKAYDDAKWHQVVAAQGNDGMNLYVDGHLVAHGTYTAASVMTGYWRTNGDSIPSTWPSHPTTAYLYAYMSDVSVYLSELSAARVLAHYDASSLVPNQLPTAAFTFGQHNQAFTFDGSTSNDPDGTVVAWNWNFGDGSTGTGVTASHTYSDTAQHTVTLTVTDNKGGTASTHQTVTPKANTPPTAVYTQTCSVLTCYFDGSGSSDADGSVAGYSWNFGDGSSATGVAPVHHFAAAGTYTVVLTVTDDQGATGSQSTGVVVAAPSVVAADQFHRTVSNGFGTASPAGGLWSTPGTASKYAVNDPNATMTLLPGASGTATLSSVSAQNTDYTVTISMDSLQSQNYVWLISRLQADGSAYRMRVKVDSDNSITISLWKAVGSTVTQVASYVMPSLSFTPNAQYDLRFDAVQTAGGTGVRLGASMWAHGSTQPDGWLVSYTDTSSLLGAGSVGVLASPSGTSTTTPVVFSLSNLAVNG
jgi:PKD repeat protein